MTRTLETASLPARRELRGLLLAVLVAFSFATNSALARLAYEAGSNALSVLTVRTAVALVVLALLLQLTRVPMGLGRSRAAAALALGLLLAAYSYGLLGSIQYVPLAVGLVTFYTFPLLTALGSAAIGRERLDPLTLVALLIALYGLALVLDLRGESVDGVGIAHALGAAVCFTALLLISDRIRGDGDSRPVTLHMLATGVVVYLAASALTGAFRLPQTGLGWLGFIGCPIFYTFSFITLFVAVREAGPVRVALVMNVEPVASALLGYLLLAQVLGPWQVLGICIVVAAVVCGRLPALAAAPAHQDWPSTLMLGAGALLLLSAVTLARP